MLCKYRIADTSPPRHEQLSLSRDFFVNAVGSTPLAVMQSYRTKFLYVIEFFSRKAILTEDLSDKFILEK